MNATTRNWDQQVLEAICRIAGPDSVNELEEQWRRHAANTLPVITFFGAYDSGKSTLLKRLLVDAGVPVPDWLTVAARRDTFEVNTEVAMGCIFRDTPGISSGNPDHEKAAREALVFTDLIVLVMPPQLVTGDKETILAVAAGDVFKRQGMRLGNALAFAMCKMDEGGYDPSDDPVAYERYIESKRHELLAILSRNGVDTSESKVFGLAADPNQTVVNTKNPGRVAYDEFRAWDGISAFQGWLELLPEQLDALRALGRKRFLCAAAEAHRSVLERRAVDIQLGRKEADANKERFALLQQNLNGLLKDARTSLDALIEEQLHSAALARLEDEQAVSSFVQPRLEAAVMRWCDDQNAKIDKFVATANAEIAARRQSRGAERASRIFQDNREEETHGSKVTKKTVVSLAERAEKAVRGYHETSMGMKLEKAREELGKLNQAKNFEEYVAGAGRQKTFRTLAEADRAKKIVRFHTVLSTAGPLLVELGFLIWEEKQREELERKRQERRQKIKVMVKDLAQKIGQQEWQAWEVQATELQAWLSQNEQAANTMSELLDEELQTVSSSQVELDKLLTQVV